MDLLFLIWLSIASVVTPTPPIMLASSLIDIGVENPIGGSGIPPVADYLLINAGGHLLLNTGSEDALLINQ